MSDNVTALVWLAVAVLCLWPFYVLTARMMLGDDDPVGDMADVVICVLFAGLGAALWPLVLFMLAAFRLSRLVWRRVLGEDARDRVR